MKYRLLYNKITVVALYSHSRRLQPRDERSFGDVVAECCIMR